MLRSPIEYLFHAIKLPQKEEEGDASNAKNTPPTNNDTVTINRIQDQVQDFSQNIAENMQTNLFLIELPLLLPETRVATKDRPIFVDTYNIEDQEPTQVRQVGHPDQSNFQRPICIGIARNAVTEPNQSLMISTVIHTSNRLKLGIIMKFPAANKQVLGIDEGVGLVLPL